MQKILLAVVASVLVVLFIGCGKPAANSATPSPGQTFNAIQYFQDFGSASPELQTLANKAWMSVQSGAFPAALKSLAQLEANPVLNDSQKKSVAALTEQIKKQMAASTATR